MDLKARSAKGARFSGVHPKGGNSQCSNVCLWRTFAKNAARRKPSFDLLYHAHKIVQIGVSARGHFLQKCAIDRHLSTENFSLRGRPPKGEHLWLNVRLHPPKYTNGFATWWRVCVKHSHNKITIHCHRKRERNVAFLGTTEHRDGEAHPRGE